MLVFASLLYLLGTLGTLGTVLGTQHRRIVGGDYISVDNVPYQVVIRQRINAHKTSQCGAILIAPRWLLTAEHCLIKDDLEESPIEAFFGMSRLDHLPDPLGPKKASKKGSKKPEVVTRRVVRYFRGPFIEYESQTRLSDLLLLKLSRKVTTSGKIKPIKLPEVGDRWVNKTAVVSGFGARAYRGDRSPSNKLQYSQVPIVSKGDCLDLFQDRWPQGFRSLRPEIAPDSYICAGLDEGGAGSCFGDSGGPLAVCETELTSGTSGKMKICKGNRWKLAGLISFDYQCGEETPGVYVNVALFSDWIRKVVEKNS